MCALNLQMEEAIVCSICMQETEMPLTYACCKQIVCHSCYKTMHKERKRKDCPYCRHDGVSVLTTPNNAGIRRKRYIFSHPYAFMIDQKTIVKAIEEALSNEGEHLKITRDAMLIISQVLEQHGIERMTAAQSLATIRGHRLVKHL